MVVFLSFCPGFCCLPKPFQTPGSLAPQGPPASSFSALLQTAYESEGALLDEQVQARLRAALPHLPMHQVLRSAKHLLLYIRSTVETFGQVSAAPPTPGPTAPTCSHVSACRVAASHLSPDPATVSIEYWSLTVTPLHTRGLLVM